AQGEEDAAHQRLGGGAADERQQPVDHAGDQEDVEQATNVKPIEREDDGLDEFDHLAVLRRVELRRRAWRRLSSANQPSRSPACPVPLFRSSTPLSTPGSSRYHVLAARLPAAWRSPSKTASTAFCAWRRFSACSRATDCGPSRTSSVISSPR